MRRILRPFLSGVRHRMRVAAVSAIVLTSAVAGCAGGTASSEAPPTGRSASAWPILVVEHIGGYRPGRAAFTRLPAVYLAAGGRLITPAQQITVYPRPALASLLQRQLRPRGIEHLRELAAEAGLDRPPPDYGAPSLTDAPTTDVTYRSEDGRTFVHRAYALGTNASAGRFDERRRRLQRFVGEVTNIEASLGGAEVGAEKPFVAQAFEISVRPAPADGKGAAQPTRRWPLGSVRLADSAACTPVTGPDAASLRAALQHATELTRWRQDEMLYLVSSRPLLPGETPCRRRSTTT